MINMKSLINKHGLKISSTRAFKLLGEKGILERKIRLKDGKFIGYWQFSGIGLKYGKNELTRFSKNQTVVMFCPIMSYNLVEKYLK